MSDEGNERESVDDALDSVTRAIGSTIATITERAGEGNAETVIAQCRRLETQARALARLCDALLSGAEHRWVGQVVHASEVIATTELREEGPVQCSAKGRRKLATVLARIGAGGDEPPEIIDTMRRVLGSAAASRMGEDWLDDEDKEMAKGLGEGLRQIALDIAALVRSAAR